MGKRILDSKPAQLLGWGLALYIAYTIVLVPFLLALFDVSLIELYKNEKTALLSHSLVLILIIITAIIFVWLQDRPLTTTTTAPPKQSGIVKLADQPPPDVINVKTSGGNRFLRPGAIGKTINIIVNPKTQELGRMYQQKDVLFNFKTMPHVALFGASGSGKSVAVKNLIAILNKQLHYPETVILDAGGADFEQALATTNEEIRGAIDHIYWVIEGRAKEPKGSKFPPLLVLLEEAEAFWDALDKLKKQEQVDFRVRFASMILRARKFNVNFLIIAQTGAATNSIPSKVTNNISNKFYLRMEKNAGMFVHKLPFDMHEVDSGVAYFNRIDNFVKFDDLVEEPHINALTWAQLEDKARTAQRKHKLGPGSQVES